MKTAVILASSRKKGNTYKAVSLLKSYGEDIEVIDLLDYSISPFDYDFRNQGDDFIPLIRRIIEGYDCLIFATPVYWYSMSGLLKNFIDRLTDCLKIEKTLGRLLAGKKMGVISCGSDSKNGEYFFEPFKLTSEYLDMEYIGHIHTWVGEGNVTFEVDLLIKNYSILLNS